MDLLAEQLQDTQNRIDAAWLGLRSISRTDRVRPAAPRAPTVEQQPDDDLHRRVNPEKQGGKHPETGFGQIKILRDRRGRSRRRNAGDEFEEKEQRRQRKGFPACAPSCPPVMCRSCARLPYVAHVFGILCGGSQGRRGFAFGLWGLGADCAQFVTTILFHAAAHKQRNRMSCDCFPQKCS